MSLTVGGQAVIEGVMMRTPGSMAIAVRRADGSIDLRDEPWVSPGARFRLLSRPFLRGGVVLFEALLNGMSAMRWAADRSMMDIERAEAEKAARERAGTGEAASATSGSEGRDERENAAPASGSSSAALTTTLVISLLLGFGLFVALPHALGLLLGRVFHVEALDGTSPWFQATAGTLKAVLLVGYMAAISRLPDIRRVFQYHGAEHKSIFAFEAGEDLTVENARRHPRLHPRCGTSFLFLVVLTSIVVFSTFFALVPIPIERSGLRQLVLIALKLPLLFPIAGIAYEFQRLSARFPDAAWVRPILWPGLALQRITTREPTDQQVEVALASLRAALARDASRSRSGAAAEEGVVERTVAALDEIGAPAVAAAAE